KYEKWEALEWLKFPVRNGAVIDGEWRWLHWRDENPEPEGKSIEVRMLDAAGQPEVMKIDYESGKPVTVTLLNPLAAPAPAAAKPDPKIMKPKHWVTAIPFWQPWFFVVSAGFFIISVLLMVRRAWQKRWP
ncbi:MAG: hypothetical protein JWO82_1086, partial [Akkermansiaceae bacterium]|nr:hypothetical protein [Akkermansiaceae bacterium]